ncbi:MAG: hypothetical protein U5N26_05825 [Candidatus Marinimicrobia bacterium]|nr:hypothetical protein [Candidatus Neomarinimicrobiota bacterium]
MPGNCLKGYHTGCHRLIRLGAKIVEKAEDVLNEYPFLKARRDPQRNRIADMRGLNADEKALLKLIGKATLHIDGLLSLSGLPQGKLMSVLLQLEIKGYVRAEPGDRYRRIL